MKRLSKILAYGLFLLIVGGLMFASLEWKDVWYVSDLELLCLRIWEALIIVLTSALILSKRSMWLLSCVIVLFFVIPDLYFLLTNPQSLAYAAARLASGLICILPIAALTAAGMKGLAGMKT